MNTDLDAAENKAYRAGYEVEVEKMESYGVLIIALSPYSRWGEGAG